MDIKAIFFDIDGTLVSFKTHKIPSSTLEALHLLRQKGIKLIIATGRALSDINNLGDLQFDGYITANGAYCTDGNKKRIFANLIPQDNLERLVDYQKTKTFPCVFVTEKENYVNMVDDNLVQINRMVNLPIPQVKPIEEIVKYDIFQIDTFVSQEEEELLYQSVLTDCEGSRWHPAFVDITLKNTNKATGVDAMLQYLNLNLENTMSFGDGGNDISMLKHTAIGVSMGNAAEEVQAEADYMTSSVDDDGIIKALKHYGLA